MGSTGGQTADRVGPDDVVADGDEGAVVEQRDEHEHEHRQLRGWREVECYTLFDVT